METYWRSWYFTQLITDRAEEPEGAQLLFWIAQMVIPFQDFRLFRSVSSYCLLKRKTNWTVPRNRTDATYCPPGSYCLVFLVTGCTVGSENPETPYIIGSILSFMLSTKVRIFCYLSFDWYCYNFLSSYVEIRSDWSEVLITYWMWGRCWNIPQYGACCDEMRCQMPCANQWW